jgi:hypothetical protein
MPKIRNHKSNSLQNENKSLIDLKNSKITYLSAQNAKLKKIVSNLVLWEKNPDTYKFWVSEAKKYL